MKQFTYSIIYHTYSIIYHNSCFQFSVNEVAANIYKVCILTVKQYQFYKYHQTYHKHSPWCVGFTQTESYLSYRVRLTPFITLKPSRILNKL